MQNIIQWLESRNPFDESTDEHGWAVAGYNTCICELKELLKQQPADWKEGFRYFYRLNHSERNIPDLDFEANKLIEWIEQNLLPAASQGVQLEQIEKIVVGYNQWSSRGVWNLGEYGNCKTTDELLQRVKEEYSFEKWTNTKEGKALLSSISPSPWIDVNERLPEHGSVNVVYCTSGAIFTAMMFHGNWRKDGFSDMRGYDASHWQPLPQPPTK